MVLYRKLSRKQERTMALREVIYLENVKTGRKFEVVSVEDGNVTLKGAHAEFVEPYDKDRFKRLGYKMTRGKASDEPAAAKK